jgi:hypothetical protein
VLAICGGYRSDNGSVGVWGDGCEDSGEGMGESIAVFTEFLGEAVEQPFPRSLHNNIHNFHEFPNLLCHLPPPHRINLRHINLMHKQEPHLFKRHNLRLLILTLDYVC